MTMALQGGVFLAFLTKMPTYLSTVLKFEIKEVTVTRALFNGSWPDGILTRALSQNGLLTALPYLVSWLLSFPFSSSCDWFVRRGYLSLTRARKLYNSICTWNCGSSLDRRINTVNDQLSVLIFK